MKMERRSPAGVSVLVLILFWVAAAASAQQSHAKTDPAGAPAAQSGEYAGSEACATCHADEVKNFASNPHTKLAQEHAAKGATCESCHGPGKAHIDGGGDVSRIFSFTKATPKEVNERCLECHQGQHANFERSAHGEGDVTCTSCHSAHKFEEPAAMLKMKQPALCYQCHTDVKPAFSQPFHHKVNEGLMSCSDCHDPHGTFQPKQLRTSAAQDAVCVKCHTETAGPWVYEHPPIKTEGCTSCHFPHGSPNARLLTRSNVNTLCMQCHSPSMNFNAPGTPSFHNQANQYQACTVCHTQIHGSNASSVFFK
jgi:DmsE family decaheme c-type cytochrome